jgi:hypothetical protein
MKTEIYKPGQDLSVATKRGNFILIYGKSKVGKTATCLATAEDPILWILMERGQVELTLKAINRPDLRLKVAYYEGWDDLLDFIYDLSNFNQIKTTFFDGLTHTMNIHLSDELMAESFEARDINKIEKELASRAKMTPENYGVLSKQMVRLMKGFEQLTVNGIDVICTARDSETPKWDRSLSCAPALAGKEFPRDIKGFFDFIGLIQSRYDEDGKVIYPPLASFDDDGSYLSGWTGIKPKSGVIGIKFNVKKILDVAHGVKG